ncbi:MAG TPA: hypothetical protein VEC57_02755 [Candidatus Limnocylindrales bacterium]|nr:hypothetical protein [Candidatus Limnocylindrales bacterium]
MLVLTAVPASASAAACGDELPQGRVACACGDTVVTDARLLATDPVVASVCPIDGLIIRAGELAESIQLDLGGQMIRGSGSGAGVRVVYGGSHGAAIVGAPAGAHGTIAGFGTGLRADAGNRVARVSRLELRDNRFEGARLRIAGTLLEDVVARHNRGDGLYLRGTGGRLVGVRSEENGQNGIRLFTRGMAVDAIAVRNARSGIIVDGADNDLAAASARDNGRDGVLVRGSCTHAARVDGSDRIRMSPREVPR